MTTERWEEMMVDVEKENEVTRNRSISLAELVQPGAFSVQGHSVERAGLGTHSDGIVDVEQDNESNADDVEEESSFLTPPTPMLVAAEALAQPGAYSVRGPFIQRAGNERNSVYTLEEDESTSNDDEEEPSSFLVPTPLPSIAIAAELSTDAEARILDQVRERLIEEAAQLASVVAIEDEKSNRFSVNKQQYKHRNVKERLFGDARKGPRPDIAAAPDQYIRKRDLLPWTIQQDATTSNWVTRVRTNPKAKNPRDIERSLRFFRADSEYGAFEAGLTMAPPQMQPYDQNPLCFLCQSKFAVFRRPAHCHNCGVCICGPCSTNWPAKMLPETYLAAFKKDTNNQVSVCLACDWLAKEFRQALLDGNTAKVQTLHATGNVNLRTSYCLEKRGNEVMHPIHMAITSGNIELLRWLASDRFCPLTNSKNSGPLVTGKGRTPLQLSLSHLDVFQFLVVEKGLPLDCEDLNYSMLLEHISSLLKTVSQKKISVLSQNNRTKRKQAKPKKTGKSRRTRSADNVVIVPSEEVNAEQAQRRASF